MAGSTPAVSRRPRLEDNDYHINFHEVRYFKCRPISPNLVRYSLIFFYFSAFAGHFGLVLIILIFYFSALQTGSISSLTSAASASLACEVGNGGGSSLTAAGCSGGGIPP